MGLWNDNSIWHIFMGLWNDYVVISINKYKTLKVSKKYDRFYVNDFNFAKVYRNAPPFYL